MADQYHYDRNGQYQGKTSDKPPGDGGGCAAIIVILIILAAMGKCSSSGSSNSEPSGSPQTYSAPAEPPENLVPAPQPYEPPPAATETNPGEEFEFEAK